MHYLVTKLGPLKREKMGMRGVFLLPAKPINDPSLPAAGSEGKQSPWEQTHQRYQPLTPEAERVYQILPGEGFSG